MVHRPLLLSIGILPSPPREPDEVSIVRQFWSPAGRTRTPKGNSTTATSGEPTPKSLVTRRNSHAIAGGTQSVERT